MTSEHIALISLIAPAISTGFLIWLGKQQISIAKKQSEVSMLQASIANQQAHTSKESLRLDLYDRRFTIYVDAISFYQQVAVGDWKADPEAEKAHIRFVRALNESRFLFDAKSGIYPLLNEMHTRGFHIIQMKKGTLTLAQLGREVWMVEEKKFMDGLSWLGNNLPVLSDKMAVYLDFHNAIE